MLMIEKELPFELIEVDLRNKPSGFRRLELSTAKDNHIGQSLYESLGYELDAEFLHYSFFSQYFSVSF